MSNGVRKEYIKSMLGFTKKRFFITLGLAVGIWVISGIIQGNYTALRSVGTFSTGCQLTGYPIDVCWFKKYTLSPLTAILFNIVFWFFLISLVWKIFKRR